MSFDSEVIVAGAGPAGAVAARTLAAAGIETLLVDRHAFPRNKPCGGGITTRVLRRFPWLPDAIAPIDRHEVSTLHLEGPDRTVVEISSPRPCVLLIRRVEFDNALASQALAAGARFQSGFEITQVTETPTGVTLRARDGSVLKAPIVIAADGVHSVIAKRLGLNPRWPRSRLALDMMEETDTLAATRPDVLWIAYGYRDLDGYAYIFPKARHVNVGIGCLLSHYDAHVDVHPDELQGELIRTLEARDMLRGRRDADCFTPYLIPVGGPLDVTARGRVLLCGDAGGFVHGVTAEGIYYAMVTGEHAARAVAAHRHRPEKAAAAYERAWRAEIGPELADSVLLQQLLFGDRSQVREAVAAAQDSPVTAGVLEMVRGERSYASLRRRLIMRHPYLALQLARRAASHEVAL